MSRDVQFRKELDALYNRRADWLRSILTKGKRGPRKTLTRDQVNLTVRKLQDLASDEEAKQLATKELKRHTMKKRTWYVNKNKGHTRVQKKKTFKHWYDDRIGSGSCVYSFWNRKKCLYVGKTTKGHGRPAAHFEKNWFSSVTRIDVHAVSRRRDLSVLECLAIHRYKPLRNRAKAESRKWTRKCPLCRIHKDIRDEVRAIFRFR